MSAPSVVQGRSVVQAQSDVSLKLEAEKMVLSDTVRVTATISALAPHNKGEEETFTPKVMEMLRKLIGVTRDSTGKEIPADWRISSQSRKTLSSGREEMSLQANARVHESSTFCLERRSKEITQDDMSFSSVSTDNTPPSALVEEAKVELRKDLHQKIYRELRSLNEVVQGEGEGAVYYIAVIKFEDASSSRTTTNETRPSERADAGMTTYLSDKSVREAPAREQRDLSGSLGYMLKLTMGCSVVFQRVFGFTRQPLQKNDKPLDPSAGVAQPQ